MQKAAVRYHTLTASCLPDLSQAREKKEAASKNRFKKKPAGGCSLGVNVPQSRKEDNPLSGRDASPRIRRDEEESGA